MTSTDTYISNTIAFWDRAAAKYAASPVRDIPAYERKLTRLIELCRPSDTILEIGCGTGSTALQLAPHVQRMIATDISGAMVGIARNKLRESPMQNLEFRQETADHIIAEAGFDMIFASSLLHLVDDVPTVLAAVMNQLKPGGLFISKTVCIADGSWFLKPLVATMTALGFAPKVAVLSAEDVTQFILNAGFEIIETQHFNKGKMNTFIVARKKRDRACRWAIVTSNAALNRSSWRYGLG